MLSQHGAESGTGNRKLALSQADLIVSKRSGKQQVVLPTNLGVYISGAIGD